METATIRGIPVYDAIIDSDGTGMMKISLVDKPATMVDFLHFSAEAITQKYAVVDEERRIVEGPVMRANFPIYRKSDKLGEYYIVYKPDQIRKMAERYLYESRQNAVNTMHGDDTDVEGVNMVQFFIKDSAKGISPDGFADVEDGSLFAQFHVTNDDVWAAIKDGTYKGFSLEGVFEYAPETNQAKINSITNALHGAFSSQKNMSKINKILAAFAKVLEQAFGNVSTDKGIIAWDGDEDLKVGDKVYLENENGERSDLADGDYTTGDGKVIVVAGGEVTEIKDVSAEVAPNQGEETAAEDYKEVTTDNGTLLYQGESDLAAGAEVFVRDDEGNTVPAPDGDYKTEDGKVIKVVDGKVAEIADAEAEVAPETEAQVFAKKSEKFSQSYNEKERLIYDAAVALLGVDAYPYVVDAGDDFAVVEYWKNDVENDVRYSVTWGEDGKPTLSDPKEARLAWIPKGDPDPWASNNTAEVEAMRQECESLKAEVERMKNIVPSKPAHQEFTSASLPVKTGDAKKDNLVRILRAK